MTRSNCLVFALCCRCRYGGRIGVLKWSRPWPHFAVFLGPWAVHYESEDKELPPWRQFWFKGREDWAWSGPPTGEAAP